MSKYKNLYSVSLTLSTILEKPGYTKLSIISGVLGTILAVAGFSNYFIDFLNILAIFSPSIAAIYILDFFSIKKQIYDLEKVKDWGFSALISWIIASIFALLSYYEIFSISGVYFIDSFLIGGLCYLVLEKVLKLDW